MYFGPWEIFDSFYLCMKFDRTVVHKFILTALLSVVHPVVPLMLFFGMKIDTGRGFKWNGVEKCVGAPGTNVGPDGFMDYCKQGFDLLDYGAVLLWAIPHWIWWPALFNFRWAWFI